MKFVFFGPFCNFDHFHIREFSTPATVVAFTAISKSSAKAIALVHLQR
jgi:hypothetical protein